jgi:hypothetical protein
LILKRREVKSDVNEISPVTQARDSASLLTSDSTMAHAGSRATVPSISHKKGQL